MINFFLTHGTYLGIIAVLILTGSGLPIPEEVPIIAAGILSAHEQMDPWLALGSCLIGALLGDCVMYWLGRHFGRRVLREHHWWTRFVKPDREARIEAMLQQHGLKIFFLARFLVGIRSPVYLSAGILRVPFRRFLLIDLFCASMVIGVFFGLSYYFGPTITHLVRDVEYMLTGIVVVVLASLGGYLWYRHRQKVARSTSRSDVLLLRDTPAGDDLPDETETIAADWSEIAEHHDQYAGTPHREA
jgi:membrane protein DedA with SNARE-associated domain